MHKRIMRELEYFKPRRFPIYGKPLPESRANRYLSKDDSAYLLSGRVIIEEKMDGRPVSFSAGKRYLLFAEDLKAKHSVFYRVPGRYAIFDIFDRERNVFVFPEEKLELALAVRKGTLRVDGMGPDYFFPIPSIECGIFGSPEELVRLAGISAYAVGPKTSKPAHMEGVVVKPYRDIYPEEQVRGKYVRPEFEQGIEKHYTRVREERNIIDPRIELVLRCTSGSKNGTLC